MGSVSPVSSPRTDYNSPRGHSPPPVLERRGVGKLERERERDRDGNRERAAEKVAERERREKGRERNERAFVYDEGRPTDRQGSRS